MVKLYVSIKEAAEYLSESSSPMLDAQLLMCHVLDVDRSYLFMNREIEINEYTYNKYIQLIEQRKNGKPLQYITGDQEFMGLPFKVEEGVLIPRCDTETLVEKVIECLRDKQSPLIADVGCGSGAISVSIASFIKDAKVFALDIMDIPLRITAENAKLNNVDNRVEVKKSDMLLALEGRVNEFDLIVSNPPYIRSDVISELMVEVKDHEPISALDGGDDGLIFYRNITNQALPLLKKGGILAYEIGHDQGVDVSDIMTKCGYRDVAIIKDLAGLDRVVIGKV
ncbi:MAG: peptide chain release factor N(5)-glutamine methyltransferase [Clostridium sp.]